MQRDYRGLADVALNRTLDELHRGIDNGWHHGAQLYVSREGRVVADLAVGEAEPGRLLMPDDIMLWLSSGKPLTACVIARLWEQGQLRLDDLVSRYIPEFAANGKEQITIRHCLTHTGGFRHVEHGWPEVSWDESIRRVCAAAREPDWVPGRKGGYHVASSWYILAEVAARVDGRDFSQLLRDEVLRPLEMDASFSGMNELEYHSFRDRLVPMFNRWRGSDEQRPWHDLEHCMATAPGGNNRGPARELGRFYEMLLTHSRGQSGGVLQPQTIDALTARHRSGMHDETFRHHVDFGLGFIVDSNHYGAETVPYGFGRHCSPRTFGHGGNQSSVAFADPACQLVVVVVTNGMPGEPRHNARNREINTAIYADLGLADS